jgi:competence protein ComGC
MKLIQEKITYGRAKTVVLLVIVLLILSVVTTLAMIYLADFFTN